MADGTAIEWTDASWNPVRAQHATPEGPKIGWHCEKVSPGCKHCYAEGINLRLGTGHEFKPGRRRKHRSPHPSDAPTGDVSIFLDEKILIQPLRWKRPRMIFPGSMTDIFADFVTDEMITRIFTVCALAQQHVFQFTTKRPQRMRDIVRRLGEAQPWICPGEGIVKLLAEPDGKFFYASNSVVPPWPLPNVWLGVSVEDQQRADERIPVLLDTPAAVRWISAEPLLGPVNLTKIGGTACLAQHGACCGDRPWVDAIRGIQGCSRAGAYSFPIRNEMPRGLDWIVCGGESGRNARPMHPDWARSLRDQCAAARGVERASATGKQEGVPFFFKQWGEWAAADRIKVEGGADYVSASTSEIGLAAKWGDETRDAETAVFARVGKKAAGRLLDGRTHDGMPEIRA